MLQCSLHYSGKSCWGGGLGIIPPMAKLWSGMARPLHMVCASRAQRQMQHAATCPSAMLHFPSSSDLLNLWRLRRLDVLPQFPPLGSELQTARLRTSSVTSRIIRFFSGRTPGLSSTDANEGRPRCGSPRSCTGSSTGSHSRISVGSHISVCFSSCSSSCIRPSTGACIGSCTRFLIRPRCSVLTELCNGSSTRPCTGIRATSCISFRSGSCTRSCTGTCASSYTGVFARSYIRPCTSIHTGLCTRVDFSAPSRSTLPALTTGLSSLS
jgi:hypothetical protein